MEITIQAAELDNERLSEPHLDKALQALRLDGYVILENIVDHTHLDILCERMDADSQKLIATQQWGGAGRLTGHLQQGPPPFPPYVFRDIVANPFVVQVTKALLGEGVFNSFYNGNTNCSGSVQQPLHADGRHLWSGMKVAHPIASVVVNISPLNVTEENGSIELWPGSHLNTNIDRRIDESTEVARREISPPIRGNAKKGSALIRDVRLWHRGVPNESDRPRHMIAMIHNVSWLQRERRLQFGKGCETEFENSDLDANVDFVDSEYDYLSRESPNYRAFVNKPSR